MKDNDDLRIFNDTRFGLTPGNFMTENYWDSFNFGGFKVKIIEKNDSYIFDAKLPGIDKKYVNIDINNNILTIAVKINESNETKDKSGTYTGREMHRESFKRSFSLDNIKSEEIKAEMKNGILTIVCPKKEEIKLSSRKVEIQ